MNKTISNVKKIYEEGKNIIEYLKSIDGREVNSIEDIMISYDFQAGTYVENYERNKEKLDLLFAEMAEILHRYVGEDVVTIMEAGIGEATTLVPIIKNLEEKRAKLKHIYGFDISWSRIKYAEKFIGDSSLENYPLDLFVGNLKEIPVKDNSVDVVFTSHAIEPNGGSEKEILQELYRVTARYLILFEPAYELANDEQRKRMKKHGYVTKIYETAMQLGYNVEMFELLEHCSNPLNPTGVMVINKKRSEDKGRGNATILCDPISKQDIIFGNAEIYCNESMLAYPIIKGIPMLIKDNAILATKYNEF